MAIVDSKEMIYRQVVGSFRIQEIPFYFGFVTIQADWDFA